MLHQLIGPKSDSKSERKTRLEIEELKSDLASIEQSRKSLNPTTDKEMIERLDKRARGFTLRLADLWDIEEKNVREEKKEKKEKKKPVLVNAPVIKIPSVTSVVVPIYNTPKDIRPELYTIGVLGKMTVSEKEKLVQDIESIQNMTIGQNDLKKKLKIQISRTKPKTTVQQKTTLVSETVKPTMDVIDPEEKQWLKHTGDGGYLLIRDVPTKYKTYEYFYIHAMQRGVKLKFREVFEAVGPTLGFIRQLLKYPKCYAIESDWQLLKDDYEIGTNDPTIQAAFVARVPQSLEGAFYEQSDDKEFMKRVLSMPDSADSLLRVSVYLQNDIELVKLAIENGGYDSSTAILKGIRDQQRYYLRTEEGPWDSVEQLDNAVYEFPDEIVLDAIKKNAYNIFGASPKQTHDSEFLRKAMLANPYVEDLIKEAQEPGSDIDIE
jgi:hypothetical protein